ncbi:tRNA (guanine(37)-N1)-methyltransferase [Malaya genurostris]|uniref:tRNA (guanine(37)-N1)-methyltransferase n=1 Tax=Malaya genurostris TaxID=325434 RepID=UPI0026F3C323|nr:tRNA (guanine(37)-N1)-methyltransferase [Malaya genurostris]XP_058462307.1 tRNA (guanine(37)-N1)-methyltransferase [Malaya genurostris]
MKLTLVLRSAPSFPGSYNTNRFRHYIRNMACTELHPPTTVRGMTVLDRDAFIKHVRVPVLKVPENLDFNLICTQVKTLLLKMERNKPVKADKREIMLHPSVVQSWSDVRLEDKGLEEENLLWQTILLKYENWKYNEILKAVLPDEDSLSAFSKIGHIIHLNLKDHLLPYKTLIGEVLMDKIPACRTVVNKLNTIDNTYRNFQMDLLAGEENYQVSVKENGVTFEFDFSKVYWNPRLATEHEKIVKMLNKDDILLDVYAGVGPFSVPAARKGCIVLANDLNPDSYKSLLGNCLKNKVNSRTTCFNKNGIDFIREEIRAEILTKNQDNCFNGDIHITMNLPALAVEHLSYYVGLLKGESLKLTKYPLVHVYCFAKGAVDHEGIAQGMVEQNIGLALSTNLKEIAFVRNVAPNKNLMRISFYLTEEILFSNSADLKRSADVSFDSLNKRLRVNNGEKEREEPQPAEADCQKS